MNWVAIASLWGMGLFFVGCVIALASTETYNPEDKRRRSKLGYRLIIIGLIVGTYAVGMGIK